MRASMAARPLQGSVDQRTPITAWDLLVWAYKRQMVHYEPDGQDGPQMRSQASTFASLAETGWFDRSMTGGQWSINPAGTTAHPDAHRVHDRVCRLARSDRDLIIRSAIQGSPPDWNPEIHPFRVVPVRKGGSGNIRMIYGRSHRPIACMIDYEGIPDEEAEGIRQTARETYALWWKLLRRLRLSLMLADDALTRWRVTDIGAMREPWTKWGQG